MATTLELTASELALIEKDHVKKAVEYERKN